MELLSINCCCCCPSERTWRYCDNFTCCECMSETVDGGCSCCQNDGDSCCQSAKCDKTCCSCDSLAGCCSCAGIAHAGAACSKCGGRCISGTYERCAATCDCCVQGEGCCCCCKDHGSGSAASRSSFKDGVAFSLGKTCQCCACIAYSTTVGDRGKMCRCASYVISCAPCEYIDGAQKHRHWKSDCCECCATGESNGSSSDESCPLCTLGEAVTCPWCFMSILSSNITVAQARRSYGDAHVGHSTASCGIDPCLLCMSMLFTPFFGAGILIPSVWLRYKMIKSYNLSRRRCLGDECCAFAFPICSWLQISHELRLRGDHLGTVTVARTWTTAPSPQRMNNINSSSSSNSRHGASRGRHVNEENNYDDHDADYILLAGRNVAPVSSPVSAYRARLSSRDDEEREYQVMPVTTGVVVIEPDDGYGGGGRRSTAQSNSNSSRPSHPSSINNSNSNHGRLPHTARMNNTGDYHDRRAIAWARDESI